MNTSELWSHDVFANIVKFAKKDARNIARRMAQQYEMKKKAWEAVNTSHRKSGSIDSSRIVKFKTSDNIFMKKSMSNEGTSHGLILTIDWSGSMDSLIKKVACQFLITTLYCKYIKIPFEVYTFTNGESGKDLLSGLSFRLIASNKNSEAELMEIFAHMYSYGAHSRGPDVFTSRYVSYIKKHFGQLRCTPLYPAMMMSYHKAHEMRNSTGMENISIMFITDGEGDCDYSYASTIQDPYSVRSYSYNSLSVNKTTSTIISAINKMIRDSGFKTFNIFLTHGDVSRSIGEFFSSHDEQLSQSTKQKLIENAVNDFKKQSFTTINNFMFYNTWIGVNTNLFPEDKAINNNVTTPKTEDEIYHVLKNENTLIKNLSTVGSTINDILVSDFKIK